MAQHIRERFNWPVEVPEHGQKFELDVMTEPSAVASDANC